MKTKKQNKNGDEIIIRQVSDHLFQTINRIRENIEYIVFLRKNTKLQEVSMDFLLKQIDRFSRDVLISFGHLLDDDREANTVENLLNRIKDPIKKTKFQRNLISIREEGKFIKEHRNKIIAHHNTKYNAKFSDYYPAQPFNHVYILDPCFSAQILEKVNKIFEDIFEELKIDGVGSIVFGGGLDFEKVFKTNILGKCDEKYIKITHDCSARKCLIK